MGRFINADGFISTGEGLLGCNMYAYCNNNPVMNIDPTGYMVTNPAYTIFKSLAVRLLTYWLLGDGSSLYFDDSSVEANAFRSSPKMNAICNDAIENYKKTGETHYEGSDTISGFNDFDVWMAACSINYSIDITTRVYYEKILWWKKQKEEYILTITIHDKYDFNSGSEKGNGLGSMLNNIA